MVVFYALVNLSLFLRFKWHIAFWQGGGGGGEGNLSVLCKLTALYTVPKFTHSHNNLFIIFESCQENCTFY